MLAIRWPEVIAHEDGKSWVTIFIDLHSLCLLLAGGRYRINSRIQPKRRRNPGKLRQGDAEYVRLFDFFWVAERWMLD
ncbi:hypothetical protein ACIGHN_11835 [Acidovorax sp. NPDC077693]|uniref:hypothetical protein n=1 Tax=unclassified Acidovorax TaxID=2684926 RepID=UPI0037CACD9E